MASPFLTEVIAMQAEVFADLGFDATYTPAGGGAPVTGVYAIPDIKDVETLADVFAGARTRTTQQLIAIRKAHVADRPAKGALIAIPGFGDFTVTEDAMCVDRFQLVWICAVHETPPPPPPGP
jgi:hypothetical protein